MGAREEAKQIPVPRSAKGAGMQSTTRPRQPRGRLGAPGAMTASPQRVDADTQAGAQALAGAVAVTPMRTAAGGSGSLGGTRGRSRGTDVPIVEDERWGAYPGDIPGGSAPHGGDSPPSSSSSMRRVPSSPSFDTMPARRPREQRQSTGGFGSVGGGAGSQLRRPSSPLVAPVVPSATQAMAEGRASVGGLVRASGGAGRGRVQSRGRGGEESVGRLSVTQELQEGDPRVTIPQGGRSPMAHAARAASRAGAGRLDLLDRGRGMWSPGGDRRQERERERSRSKSGSMDRSLEGAPDDEDRSEVGGRNDSGTSEAPRSTSRPRRGQGRPLPPAPSSSASASSSASKSNPEVPPKRRGINARRRSGTGGTDGAALEVWASAAEEAAQANEAKRARLRRARALASGDARQIAEDRATGM